jgi:hypothetical protein
VALISPMPQIRQNRLPSGLDSPQLGQFIAPGLFVF